MSRGRSRRSCTCIAGAEELGRVYQADLLINSGMPEFAAMRRSAAADRAPAWQEQTAKRASRLRSVAGARADAGRRQHGEVDDVCDERLPADTIVTNGAGNFAAGSTVSIATRAFARSSAPTSGAMGYGVPAGDRGQARASRTRRVCFSGDGDFLMNGPGARDRRALRAQVIVHRRQQRHVRHDPHAPGARVSGSRQRHRL